MPAAHERVRGELGTLVDLLSRATDEPQEILQALEEIERARRPGSP